MLARITTYFQCTEDELWERLIQPSSLTFVSSPILSFEPKNEVALPVEWQVGKSYPLKLYFLTVIPIGKHTIKLVEIDKKSKTIRTMESGRFVRVWNHNITFRETEPEKVKYTDEIEIKSGLLTPAIWLFAHFFYRHRQKRWRVLLKSGSSDRHHSTPGNRS